MTRKPPLMQRAANVYGIDCSYHTILSDTASSLIGSETLRGLLEHCIDDGEAKDITWNYDN